MSFKPVDDRQIVNRAALANIGSPANDTLDDIFNKIDALLTGVTGSAGYIAKQVSLSMGDTSLVVTIPSQPDLSYVVFPILENLVDPLPQYQQLEVTSKSTTGFTIKWNSALGSNNYTLVYVIPFKSIQGSESPMGSGSTSNVVNLNIPQNGSNYAILGTPQNLVDPLPQFQTPVITTQTSTTFTDTVNAPTSSANYTFVNMGNPTAQILVGSSVTSITATLPVPYGSTGYGVVACLSNTTDASPLFQPLIITAKSSTQFTVGLNVPTPSANYKLTYYAISFTS